MDAHYHREANGLPEMFKSYIRALSRVRDQEVILPEQLRSRAERLLEERFGQSEEQVGVGFSHGALGLLAQHTRFGGGFAILLPVQQGVAIAIRKAASEQSVIAFEGYGQKRVVSLGVDRMVEKGDTSPSSWALVVGQALDVLQMPSAVEIAVVCTLQPACFEPLLASLTVSLLKAKKHLFGDGQEELKRLFEFRDVLSNTLGSPFSLAYLVGAHHGNPPGFVAVDTALGEYVVLEGATRQELAWGLVDVGTGAPLSRNQYIRMAQHAEEARRILQKAGYEGIRSVFEIDHADLDRALSELPRRLRPTVRHLAQENRRVQNMINAIRRKDWQMVGALLLMSHASLKSEWAGTNQRVDSIIDIVKEMALDGIYGACMTGRSGCVLVGGAAQPIAECLSTTRRHFEEKAEYVPQIQIV